MNDAPMGAETPTKSPGPKTDTRPDAPVQPKSPPEAAAKPAATAESPQESAPVAPKDARITLEAIAEGPKEDAKPAEQTPQGAQIIPETPEKPTEEPAPTKTEEFKELGPDKEKVDAILTAGTQLLLDTGDKRAVLTALARHVAATPLGMELRRDVIASIAELKPDKLTSDQAATLTSLQHDIASLNMSKTDPARSEFAKFLEEYSQQNPDKAIPAPIIEAIRTNKLDRAAQIASVLQTDTMLSAKLNEQFKGDRTEPLANVATADGLLKAAGLPATPENTAKAAKVLEPPPPPDPRSTRNLADTVMPTLMNVALVIMFMNQLTSIGEGAGGH